MTKLDGNLSDTQDVYAEELRQKIKAAQTSNDWDSADKLYEELMSHMIKPLDEIKRTVEEAIDEYIATADSSIPPHTKDREVQRERNYERSEEFREFSIKYLIPCVDQVNRLNEYYVRLFNDWITNLEFTMKRDEGQEKALLRYELLNYIRRTFWSLSEKPQ